MAHLQTSSAEADNRSSILPSEVHTGARGMRTEHATLPNIDAERITVLHEVLRGDRIIDDADDIVRRAVTLLSGDVTPLGGTEALQEKLTDALPHLDLATAVALVHGSIKKCKTPDGEPLNPRAIDRILSTVAKQRNDLVRAMTGQFPSVIPSDYGPAKSMQNFLEDTETRHCTFRRLHPEIFAEQFYAMATATNRPDETRLQEVHQRLYEPLTRLFAELIRDSKLQHAYATDLPKLFDACCYLTVPNANVVLTVGFGGSPDAVTTRLPAQILSALKMMTTCKKFFDAGVLKSMPRLRLLHGEKLCNGINDGMSPKDVHQCGEQRMRVLHAFVKQFLPSISPYMFSDNDEELDIPVNGTAKEFFDAIHWPEQFNTAIERLVRNSVANGRIKSTDDEGARKKAKEYTVGHPHVFLDLVEKPLRQFGFPDATISIGGRAELPFNIAREELLNHFDSHGLYANALRPTRVKLISVFGLHPTYYATKQDTPIHQWSQGPLQAVNPELDRQTAKSVGADLNGIVEFLAGIQSTEKPSTEDKNQAEIAYRDFCTRIHSEL